MNTNNFEPNTIGGGYGGAGFGSGTLIEGLLFGALLGRGNGLFGGNDAGGAYAMQNTILEQTIAQNAALNAGVYSINSTIGEVTEAVQGVSTQILEAKYDNALQMCAQTNALSTQMNAGFQSIKDDLTCSKIADLERQLLVAQLCGCKTETK